MMVGEDGPKLWIPETAGTIFTAWDISRLFDVPVCLIDHRLLRLSNHGRRKRMRMRG